MLQIRSAVLSTGGRSIGAGRLELTSDDATRTCHRMHVHINITVAGLFEDRCQGRSAGSVDDVGVGNRRVAYPLAVNVGGVVAAVRAAVPVLGEGGAKCLGHV